jgi:hypothetical protein
LRGPAPCTAPSAKNSAMKVPVTVVMARGNEGQPVFPGCVADCEPAPDQIIVVTSPVAATHHSFVRVQFIRRATRRSRCRPHDAWRAPGMRRSCSSMTWCASGRSVRCRAFRRRDAPDAFFALR